MENLWSCFGMGDNVHKVKLYNLDYKVEINRRLVQIEVLLNQPCQECLLYDYLLKPLNLLRSSKISLPASSCKFLFLPACNELSLHCAGEL